MASILPTSSKGFNAYYYEPRRRNSQSFLRRLFRFPQMDFEFALWQMFYLIITPRRVYRNIYYHKQTKNQWSRDDPAFIVLIVSFLTLAGIAWSIAYGFNTFGTIKTVLFMVLVDFLLVGAIISTFTWFVTNRFLTQNVNAYAVAQKVEWAYAFDVHCNSFIPVYFILYVIQLFFLPLLFKNGWISLFIGNLMYCVAMMWYMTGTFLGFNALPFLVHTELFLYPVALCIALFIASLFGVNMSQYILGYYFS